MTLIQQVYAQAALLSGVEQPLLEVFCRSAVSELNASLRPGLMAEDLQADFIAAAALYALAAYSEAEEPEQVQLGELSVRRGGSAAARCLRNQAGLIMAPYVLDSFSFRGV